MFRLRIIACVALLAVLGAIAAHAGTINVPGDYGTIQAAINAATAGDTINVAADTYRELLVWDNKDLTIVGAGIGSTVVNADTDSNGIGDGRCLTATNLSSTSSITGFTFEKGVAPAATNLGGGVYMNTADVQMSECEIADCSAASGGGLCIFNSGLAFVENCSIHDCTATNWGGGLYGASGPSVVTGCDVHDNQANYGGGLRFGGTGTGTLVEHCAIYSNEATTDGGAVSLQEAPVNFQMNDVYDNTADTGGAMYLYGAAATIYGNLIHHNFCNTSFAGIYALNSGATVEGNTIASNNDGGLANGTTIATPAMIIKNNILYGNLSVDLGGTNFTSTYNCIGSGITAGTGNITSDPLFADAANADFHLKSVQGRWNGATWVSDLVNSPAIDAGDPASPYSAEPTPNGSRRNMGAYGHTAEASLTGDGVTPAVDGVTITPDPAYTNNDLTATPGTWFDPNGDPEGYDYQWAKWNGASWNDIVGATTDTLGAANFVRGDMLRITCWPNDGTNVGNPVTDEITISNSAPSVTSVAITPDPAVATDDLTAVPSGWNDADGDPEGYDYQWAKWDGAVWQDLVGETAAVLSSTNFVKGDQIQVTATPNDGTVTGAAVTDEITIADAPPTAAITAPGDGSTVYDTSVLVQGTAGDDTGLEKVIMRVNGGPWVRATGTANWSAWADINPGVANLVEACARDNVGQWGTIVGITLNGAPNLRPVARFTSPAEGATVYDSSVLVQGTADDDVSLDKVIVRINGGAWVRAAGTSTWSAWLNLTPGAANLVEARARDSSGQFGPTAAMTLNAAASLRPVVMFTAPAGGSTVYDAAALIQGTASDDTGLDKVIVRVNGGPWVRADGAANWQVWMNLGSGPNVFEAMARDIDGQWGPTATMTLNGVSNLRPVTMFTAPPDGSTVYDAAVQVQGTAIDDTGLDKVIVRVNGGAWVRATGTATWSAWINVGTGPNLVEARARDATGQWGPIVSRTLIGAANLQPVAMITSPADGSDTSDAQVTVSGTAVDDGAVVKVIVRVNGGAWVRATGTTSWSQVVNLAVGANLIEACAYDDVGLWGPIVGVTVNRTGAGGAALTASVLATPTSAGAEVCVTLSADASVTAEVLNIAGRPVRTIVQDRAMPAGMTTVAWNGRSQNGLAVPSGTYLVRVTAREPDGGSVTALQPLMLTR